MKNQKTITAISNALMAMEKAFYAVNTLAVVTRVNLSGYDIEYYKAKTLLIAWKNALENENA